MEEDEPKKFGTIIKKCSRTTAQVVKQFDRTLKHQNSAQHNEIKKTPPISQPREMSASQRKSIERKIVAMFDDLTMILESVDFDKSLKECLENAAPKYMTSISKRKKDILKTDHGIVIAGETSSGKSTLINKILGIKIFIGRNRESTSTVCKIRNSEKVVIKQEMEMGTVCENDISDIDVTTEGDVKRLRDILKTLTDITVDEGSKKSRSVDIGIPAPFLKGNTVMVDTPGIGGSGQLIEKLMEYLPNAVSFIFVINAASAGGMQRDRLPEILNSIKDLIIEDEMPCFDPRGVIFVTNKWDSIQKDSDDDEDEVEKTWQSITSSIHRLWPLVKNENIFRMNLREISYRGQLREETHSSREFEKFRHVLENVIMENENIRMTKHFRFLKGLLQDTCTGVRSRQELAKKSRSEQDRKRQDQEKKILELKEKCKKNGTMWRKRSRKFIQKQATKGLKYMSSDIGKERILNPKNLTPIMKRDFSEVDDVVNSRVKLYVQSIVESPEVCNEFKSITDEIYTLCKELSSEMEKMENELKGLSDQDAESTKKESAASYIVGIIASFPLWFPLLAASFVIGIVTLPIVGPILALLRRDARKQTKIDEEYKKCISTVQSDICNALESNYGDTLNKLISKVTDDILHRRIKFIEETIKKLSDDRDKIIANQGFLNRLAEKLEPVKRMSGEIEKDLE